MQLEQGGAVQFADTLGICESSQSRIAVQDGSGFGHSPLAAFI